MFDRIKDETTLHTTIPERHTDPTEPSHSAQQMG